MVRSGGASVFFLHKMATICSNDKMNDSSVEHHPCDEVEGAKKVPTTTYHLISDIHSQTLSQSLVRLLREQHCCDCHISTGYHRPSIRAHRLILSAFSPYFQKLFDSIQSESKPAYFPVIIIKDFSYEAIQHIVEFCYKGQISVEQEYFDEVIQAANFLQIQGADEWNIRCSTTNDNDINKDSADGNLPGSRANFKKRISNDDRLKYSQILADNKARPEKQSSNHKLIDTVPKQTDQHGNQDIESNKRLEISPTSDNQEQIKTMQSEPLLKSGVESHGGENREESSDSNNNNVNSVTQSNEDQVANAGSDNSDKPKKRKNSSSSVLILDDSKKIKTETALNNQRKPDSNTLVRSQLLLKLKSGKSLKIEENHSDEVMLTKPEPIEDEEEEEINVVDDVILTKSHFKNLITNVQDKQSESGQNSMINGSEACLTSKNPIEKLCRQAPSIANNKPNVCKDVNSNTMVISSEEEEEDGDDDFENDLVDDSFGDDDLIDDDDGYYITDDSTNGVDLSMNRSDRIINGSILTKYAIGRKNRKNSIYSNLNTNTDDQEENSVILTPPVVPASSSSSFAAAAAAAAAAVAAARMQIMSQMLQTSNAATSNRSVSPFMVSSNGSPSHLDLSSPSSASYSSLPTSTLSTATARAIAASTLATLTQHNGNLLPAENCSQASSPFSFNSDLLMAAAVAHQNQQTTSGQSLSNPQTSSSPAPSANGSSSGGEKRGRGRPPKYGLFYQPSNTNSASSSPQPPSIQSSGSSSLKSAAIKQNGCQDSSTSPGSNTMAIPLATGTASLSSSSSSSSSSTSSSTGGLNGKITSTGNNINNQQLPVVINQNRSRRGRPPTLSVDDMVQRIQSRPEKAGQKQCPHCPQVYYGYHAMHDHITSVHLNSNEKYPCHLCDKEYSWRITLRKHLKSQHGVHPDILH